ncbi:MAG: bifunctional riboflavin kinase/FAD synthetase [Lentisphaerae bacterium]|nr:bifunctional riboflavin kinase/FAD synthetase [Lentisphaerota bacterium]
MKILRGLSLLRREQRPIALAAGFFDGVHCGHQDVLQQALSLARELRGSAWVLTFDQHPLKVLQPESAPLLLCSTEHKIQLLEDLGLAGCVILPFTRQLAQTMPEMFVKHFVTAVPQLRHIVVGRNWSFGRGGQGNASTLKNLAKVYGIQVTVIPPRYWSGTVISSTRIRNKVLTGHLDHAARMLGRPFSILGTVVAGDRLGRKLGIPTANLDAGGEVRPPNGVYAVQTRLDGKELHGIVNLGVRPTLKNAKGSVPILELHVFDIRRDLYGKEIEVFFLKKFRNETKFPSLEELKKQIRVDILEVQRWFKTQGDKAFYTGCR